MSYFEEIRTTWQVAVDEGRAYQCFGGYADGSSGASYNVWFENMNSDTIVLYGITIIGLGATSEMDYLGIKEFSGTATGTTTPAYNLNLSGSSWGGTIKYLKNGGPTMGGTTLWDVGPFVGAYTANSLDTSAQFAISVGNIPMEVTASPDDWTHLKFDGPLLRFSTPKMFYMDYTGTNASGTHHLIHFYTE